MAGAEYWEFHGDQGWTMYDQTSQTTLENSYQNKDKTVKLPARNGSYVITFDFTPTGHHTQKNQKYGTVRQVRRVDPLKNIPQQQPQLPPPPPPQSLFGYNPFGFGASSSSSSSSSSVSTTTTSSPFMFSALNACNPFSPGSLLSSSSSSSAPFSSSSSTLFGANSNQGALWYVDADEGNIQYSYAHAMKLEQAYQQGKDTVVELHIGKHRYHVSMSFSDDPNEAPELTQTNRKYGTVREVFRKSHNNNNNSSNSIEDVDDVDDVSEDTEQEPWEKECKKLRDHLLSGSCIAVSNAKDIQLDVKPLTNKQIMALLRDNVPNVDKMMFRNSHQPISEFIVSTYNKGLRMVQSNPALVEHSKNAIRFIFDKVTKLAEHERKSHLKALCEAYTACQAEQARVIDDIFGQISGRDKPLREQVLALLDRFKQRTLDEVTLHYHPGCDVSLRLPHIQSRYRLEAGNILGLSGMENAKLDQHIESGLPVGQVDRFVARFRKRFSTIQFVKAFVSDVNQQDEDAERFILPKTLFQWAQPTNSIENKNFESHSIFYDDDNEDLYDGKPTDENIYKAFVHPAVVVDILKRLFIE